MSETQNGPQTVETPRQPALTINEIMLHFQDSMSNSSVMFNLAMKSLSEATNLLKELKSELAVKNGQIEQYKKDVTDFKKQLELIKPRQ